MKKFEDPHAEVNRLRIHRATLLIILGILLFDLFLRGYFHFSIISGPDCNYHDCSGQEDYGGRDYP